MKPLLDEKGREIKPGAVLRVFHFVGSRRKRHYMYKQAVEYLADHVSGSPYLKISHLNRVKDEPWKLGDNYYLEHADGRRLVGYEVVQ